MVNILALLFLPGTVTCLLNWGYTEEAHTLDGAPCMTDCLQRKCVFNWNQHEASCIPSGKPSPIYFTSQKRDRNNDRCVSNCGYFGYKYQWCVTTQLKHWDYCSSNVRGDIYTLRAYPKAKTIRGVPCTTSWMWYGYCLKNRDTAYYWCNTGNKGHWDYCAPAGSTRIPTLSTDFRIGSYSARDKCAISVTSADLDSYISFVPDDYLENTVKVLQEEYTSLVEVISDPNSIKTKYKLTTVDMPKRSSVPVAIELKILKEKMRDLQGNTVFLKDIILKHLKEMRAAQNSEVGIDNKEIDFNEACVVFKRLWWLLMELYVCGKAVKTKVVLVIFYQNYDNPVPQAIGVSVKKKYYNGDKEHCYGQVFFNGHPESRYIV